MANKTTTVLFEGFTYGGEYRVTLTKNAIVELHVDKKSGTDAAGQPSWQRVPHHPDNQKNAEWLWVVGVALASSLAETPSK